MEMQRFFISTNNAQYIYIYIYFILNNICITITPTCFDTFVSSSREFHSCNSLKLRSNTNIVKNEIYTQGVSRLVDITAGGHFLGLCDQKSSYKHESDFGRLRSYGHFIIPVHTLVWTASYGTSWRVMYTPWWLIVCGSCNKQLAQFTTERQPVLRPRVALFENQL